MVVLCSVHRALVSLSRHSSLVWARVCCVARGIFEVLQLYVVEEVRTSGIYINCLCQYSSCTLDLELSVSRDS